jgi:hypothetical protein
MKIQNVTIEPNEWGEGERFLLLIDGEEVLSAGSGEPEDNSLGRDLSFVYKISEFMKSSYEAGVRKEPLNVENLSFDDWEQYENWKGNGK